MGKTQGEKNKETYDFYYKKKEMDTQQVYTNKIYDINFHKAKLTATHAFRRSRNKNYPADWNHIATT